MPDDSPPQQSRHSLFPRSESSLAHGVYGLIITIALLGELLHEDVENGEAALWLLGGGAVLLAAHVFSDAIGHVAASQEEPSWTEIFRIGREEIAVVSGAVGGAAVMIVAAAADLDNHRALVGCVVLGLATLAYLSQGAASHRGPLRRLIVAALAVGLGTVIVLLENIV